jgi:beta-phosphoglucomutase-like phosphatase (HAD superfamily)
VIDVWQIDTLLFDVDGTHLDSNTAHTRAWVQAFTNTASQFCEEARRSADGLFDFEERQLQRKSS